MAFRPLKEVPDHDFKVATIANSQTIAVGDAVVPGGTTHAAAVTGAAGTTNGVLGIVVSIQGPAGKVLEVTSTTVSSTNETVGGVQAVYIPTYVPMEYEADLSGAAGTTSNSNLIQMFNLSGSVNGQLDETSTGAYSTPKQFLSYGVTTYSTTKVIGHFTPGKGQL